MNEEVVIKKKKKQETEKLCRNKRIAKDKPAGLSFPFILPFQLYFFLYSTPFYTNIKALFHILTEYFKNFSPLRLLLFTGLGGKT